MARAKNTSRAEARRRTRESLRTDVVDDELAEDSTEATTAAPTERRPMFKMPDVRADLRALPGMFRSRRLLWVPLVLVAIGLGFALALPGLSAEMRAVAELYLQFFFVPPALFTFFIAGFIAPRASYLVGALYGVIAGVAWSASLPRLTALLDPAAPASTTDLGGALSTYIVVGVLYGTLAAAFAAWYRDFLRQMQERGRVRRADREAQDRARRRTERQETRRTAKKPTS